MASLKDQSSTSTYLYMTNQKSDYSYGTIKGPIHNQHKEL